MTDLLSASKSNKDSTALDPPATIKEEQASTSIVTEASSDTKEAKEPTFQITFSPQEDTKEDEEFSEQHPLVTDLIIIDHHEARSLYEDYKACYNKEEKQKLRNRIVRVLVIHDECEQMVVYLSLKDRIPGDGLCYVNMKEDFVFDTKFETAMEAAFRHIETEEQKILPTLKEYVEDKELREIGDAFKKQKNMAPQESMSAKTANVMMSLFDKLEDLMSE